MEQPKLGILPWQLEKPIKYQQENSGPSLSAGSVSLDTMKARSAAEKP